MPRLGPADRAWLMLCPGERGKPSNCFFSAKGSHNVDTSLRNDAVHARNCRNRKNLALIRIYPTIQPALAVGAILPRYGQGDNGWKPLTAVTAGNVHLRCSCEDSRTNLRW